MTFKIKFQNHHKLHISKSPAAFSWLLALGLISTSFLTASILGLFIEWYLKCLIYVTGIILSFYFIEDWQDIVLDRQQESVIMTKSNCFERYLCRFSLLKSSVVPIDHIASVHFYKPNGIKLLLRNNKEVVLIKNCLNSADALKELREVISMFLHLEKVENCGRYPEWDLWDMMNFFPARDPTGHVYSNESLPNTEETESDKLYFGYRNAIKIIKTAT